VRGERPAAGLGAGREGATPFSLNVDDGVPFDPKVPRSRRAPYASPYRSPARTSPPCPRSTPTEKVRPVRRSSQSGTLQPNCCHRLRPHLLALARSALCARVLRALLVPPPYCSPYRVSYGSLNPPPHPCSSIPRSAMRPVSSYGGKDETCPLSTGGRTRRVQLVQGRGGGGTFL